MNSRRRLSLLALLALLLGSVPAMAAGTAATFTVAGTVCDKVTQKPLSGVRIEVTRSTVSIRERWVPKTAYTGQDGRYTISGLPSRSPLKFYIQASQNGYVMDGRIVKGGNEDFSLRKPTIAGTVKGLDGNGIAGVQIRIGSLPAVPTSADGSYSVENVPSGTQSVTLEKPGYVSPQGLTIEVGETDQRHNDYTLQGNIVVKGHLRTASGQPVPGAVHVAGRFALANPQGEYTTESPLTGGIVPGRYALTATADGFAPSSQTLELTDGVQTVDITLHRLFVLKGRVTYEAPTGPGVDQLTLILTNTSSNERLTATTGGGGIYAIPNLRAGTYSLRLQNSDYQDYTDTITLSEDTSRSFSVTPKVLANLELHFRCSADTIISHGRPICGAGVTLTSLISGVSAPGRADGSANSAPYCHYDWSNAKAGTYTLKLNNLSRSYHVVNASEVILLNLDCSQFQPY